MEFANTLTALERISFYSAPSDYSPTPYTIPDSLQVVELLTGGVVYFDHNGIQPYRRGTIFWHIAGDQTICETTREEPYRCEVFRFCTSNADRIAPRVSFWNGSDDALEEFITHTHTAFQDTLDDPVKNHLLAAYCSATLLMHALPVIQPAPPKLHTPGSDEKMLHDAVTYIEKNPGTDLSVANLCNQLKIPRNRLFRIFRTLLRTTPHDYILSKRLELARRQLEISSEPIKVIAAGCGFECIEVFHRTFVKYYHQTPGEYRTSRNPYDSLHK